MLLCLLCKQPFPELVGVQLHAMACHHVTRDELQAATRRDIAIELAVVEGVVLQGWIWSLADGRDWLFAVRARASDA